MKLQSALLLSLLASAPAAAKEFQIVPGQELGEVRLGQTRAAVRQALGAPTQSSLTHGGRAVDHWERQKALDELHVVFQAGKACQVEVSSEKYRTALGISPASTLAEVTRAHRDLKRTVYLFNTEDGKGLEYFDDVRRGIAFVFSAPDDRPPGKREVWTVLVHQPGQPAIPILIQDLKNTATVNDPKSAPAGTGREASCRRFVQSFYTGYLRQIEKPHSGQVALLRYQSSAMSPELRRQLREDYEASAKNKDEIVGLDFDPILAAQDTAERYEVGAIRRTGSTYRAEVYGIWNGKRNKNPDVVPELAYQRGRWTFVNFHYGVGGKPAEKDDLLHLLKTLREDRKKHK